MVVDRLSAKQACTEEYNANQVVKITSRNTQHLLSIKKRLLANCNSVNMLYWQSFRLHTGQTRGLRLTRTQRQFACLGLPDLSSIKLFGIFLSLRNTLLSSVKLWSWSGENLQSRICGLKFHMYMNPWVTRWVGGQTCSSLPPPAHRLDISLSEYWCVSMCTCTHTQLCVPRGIINPVSLKTMGKKNIFTQPCLGFSQRYISVRKMSKYSSHRLKSYSKNQETSNQMRRIRST